MSITNRWVLIWFFFFINHCVFFNSPLMRCTALRGQSTCRPWKAVTAALTRSTGVRCGAAQPNGRTVSVCSQPIRWSEPSHPPRRPWGTSTLKVTVHIVWAIMSECILRMLEFVNTRFLRLADVTPPMAAAYLEVTDLTSKKLKYIPVPR